MIPVTKTFLPPLSEYQKYLEKIWQSGWLTNNGQFVKRLEKKLKKYLGVKYIFFVTNGTIALQIAIKSLGLPKNSEIITTPFSYVATTSSIIWEGYKPVFVDIDPDTLTLNPEFIEKAITRKTKVILPTHVFGFPCNIEKIKKIAKKYNLKIIYDGAHTFGAKYKGKALTSYGDISILSFHTTKIFHTVEGGAIITNDKKIADKISFLRNFGHNGLYDYFGLGINGKNSELHAAMGLANLKYIKKNIENRRKICNHYNQLLFKNDQNLIKPKLLPGAELNYSYYPVIFPSEIQLLKTLSKLNQSDIYPRRYFYPSLSNLPYIKDQKMPISENIASRILCLPLYYRLKKKEINNIYSIIKQSF
ncbi:DegT/DnrJ/EryC1/StrS family aminotransferase [Candidatus Beckwithbacteria bacterium]|nr:DegT/DnrJ/EryC1/StrS family aminotransferase [Candidatus Beckwithbacteria bacterium]